MSAAKPALIQAPPRRSYDSPPIVIGRGKQLPWAMPLCLLASDLIALTCVFSLLIAGRHLFDPHYSWSASLRFLPFFALLFPAFLFQNVHTGLLMHPAEEMRRVFYSLTVVFLIWAAAAFLWRTGLLYSRAVFLIGWLVSFPSIIGARALTRHWLSRKSWWGVPAVILGSGYAAQRIARKLRDGKLGVKVAGVFSEHEMLSWEHDMPPILGDYTTAPGVVPARVAEYAIVAMPSRSNLELRRLIEDHCRGFRHVLVVPDMPGFCSLGVQARDIAGELGFELPQRLFHPGSGHAKRILDIVASTLLLLALTPLFVLIAIAIKITSKGPVFYGHKRHGKDGKVFQALKFRTMIKDADKALADYLVSHTEQLPEWQRDHKLKNDPRITKVGKWLRKSSLDELPQLINVLMGQMSLVGPRPIVKEEIPKYGRGYSLYTRVLPGLTGLWQVSGRNNTTYEERIEFDEHYVRNWSVWLDIYILVRTVKTVITAEGAY